MRGAWAEAALVAGGGAAGAVARYAVALALAGASARVPWGTLVINVAGSFVLGVLLGALPAGHAGRLLLGTGFCGGFTTFSTFSAEVVGLVERGEAARAVLYAGGSVGAGVAAAFAGAVVGRALVAR